MSGRRDTPTADDWKPTPGRTLLAGHSCLHAVAMAAWSWPATTNHRLVTAHGKLFPVLPPTGHRLLPANSDDTPPTTAWQLQRIPLPLLELPTACGATRDVQGMKQHMPREEKTTEPTRLRNSCHTYSFRRLDNKSSPCRCRTKIVLRGSWSKKGVCENMSTKKDRVESDNKSQHNDQIRVSRKGKGDGGLSSLLGPGLLLEFAREKPRASQQVHVEDHKKCCEEQLV